VLLCDDPGSFTPDSDGLVSMVSVFDGWNEMTAAVEGVVSHRDVPQFLPLAI
jgi:hypothetical protein